LDQTVLRLSVNAFHSRVKVISSHPFKTPISSELIGSI
jgi:hypothetical protein